MRYYTIILCLLLSLNCHEPEAKLDTVDQLIHNGDYISAKTILKSELKKSFSDTLQYNRIHNRLKRIRQIQFFSPLDTEIQNKNWNAAKIVYNELTLALKDSSDTVKWAYSFNHFHKKSLLDSALQNNNDYFNSLQQAVKYPTTQKSLLRHKYEQLGLYLAEQDSLVSARENFDRSFRMVQISRLDSVLTPAYFLYMDGKFSSSLKKMQIIPDSLKDAHWQRLEKFLSLYADKLTLEQRFKLW